MLRTDILCYRGAEMSENYQFMDDEQGELEALQRCPAPCH